MRKQNITAAIVYLAVGGFLLQQSLQMDLLMPDGQTGPGFFPAALAGLLMLLSALLLVTSLRQRAAAAGDVEAPDEPADRPRYHRPLTLWVLLAVSVLLLDILGFVLTMVLLMAALILGLERSRGVAAYLLPVVVPMVMFLVFGTLLGARLPTLLSLG